MKKRLLIALGILVTLVVAALITAAITWPLLNQVQTGATPEYPEIQPQYYTADPQRVFDEARAGAGGLKNWSVSAETPAQYLIEATREAAFFGFRDDITIRVEPVTEFVTRVQLTSRTHFGKGDFGQNARNIQEFFDELDERLGATKLNPESLGGSAEPEAEAEAAPGGEKPG